MLDIKTYLLEEFQKTFKTNQNQIFFYFAPGRINLIGEHTDYTGGLVCPAGIECGTYIIAQKNDSTKINIGSLNFDGKIESFDTKEELRKEQKWTDYIKGILFELNKKFGKLETGFNALIYGNIPNGAGLSSSASIEMASQIVFFDMNNFDIPKPGSREMVEATLLAQRCENNFVGVNCGIMDQFAIGNAKKDYGIKLDCFNLEFSYCKIELNDYCILVSNTNKKRKLEDSQYNTRRKECEDGFKILQKEGIQKEVLGRVTIDEWNNLKHRFNDIPIIQKRLNHTITENLRVKEAFLSLEKNDIKRFACLLNESGDSLKNDFEVTGLHLDSLVESARTTDGVIASRMMGGGFGGCTISIAKKEHIQLITKEIEVKYFAKTQIKPDFYVFTLSDGAKKLS